MTTITIDEAGRIEIPADVRHQLGLHPRGILQLEVSEGRIILQLAPNPPRGHRIGGRDARPRHPGRCQPNH